MILATMETRHFTFTSLAESEVDAEALLLAAWNKHVEEYSFPTGDGPDPDLMRQAITDGEVNFTEIQLGMALRDDTVLVGR